MPPAARISDMHTCPMSDGPKPHVGGPVIAGDASVLIGFTPAARMGDQATCTGPPDVIMRGEPTVLIGNKPAARIGDNTVHGGVIVAGCPTVMIGSTPQADALKTEKPFCEVCAAAAAAETSAAGTGAVG